MPADLLCRFFSFLVKVKFSLKSCIDWDTLELTGTNQVAASDWTKFSSKPKLTLQLLTSFLKKVISVSFIHGSSSAFV